MGDKVEVSFEFIRQVQQSDAVRKALRAKADRVLARAESIAASEGVQLDARVEEMTRPKGRAEARVLSTNVAQEWGDRATARKRILGRAADSS